MFIGTSGKGFIQNISNYEKTGGKKTKALYLHLLFRADDTALAYITHAYYLP